MPLVYARWCICDQV